MKRSKGIRYQREINGEKLWSRKTLLDQEDEFKKSLTQSFEHDRK